MILSAGGVLAALALPGANARAATPIRSDAPAANAAAATAASAGAAASSSQARADGGGAVKLFETDFGGTVHLGTPVFGNGTRSRSGWWPILGGDDGFSWPIAIYRGSSEGLQPISYGPFIEYDPARQVINAAGKPCWKAEIIQGVRHDGSTGAIFHQMNYQNIRWQFPYTISPGADVFDQYQKIWMKFPANLAQQMGPKAWRSFAGWKDSGHQGPCPQPGYRIEIYVMTDASGRLFWDMHGDNCAAGPFFWDQQSHAAVPAGKWFLFEWAWHRTHDSDSWGWVKINGEKILSQQGGGANPAGFYSPTGANKPINRIFLFVMYGKSGPSEQWFDHVEIWDKVPSGSGISEGPAAGTR